MLIPKCCLNCSNKNKGACCCTLPSLYNEYVEDNTIINKQATVITNYSLNSEHGLIFKTEEEIRADERKKMCEEIRKEVQKEKEDNDLAWLGFKKLNKILDQTQGDCDE